MWQRFCQPRRLVLSAVAGVLAIVWLGNAAMTVWLRESASAETLSALLSLGLVLYATWHFAKAAFFRPESPFEWSPAERDVLAMLPWHSRDLVAYQIASVTVTTTLKTGLLTLLLLPDLRCVPLAMVGLLLAMMMLEMLRMAIDIATWGMSRAAYLAYRIGGRHSAGSRRIRGRQPGLPRSNPRWSDQRRRRAPRSIPGHPVAIERIRVGLCRRALSAVYRPDRGRRYNRREGGTGRGRSGKRVGVCRRRYRFVYRDRAPRRRPRKTQLQCSLHAPREEFFIAE